MPDLQALHVGILQEHPPPGMSGHTGLKLSPGNWLPFTRGTPPSPHHPARQGKGTSGLPHHLHNCARSPRHTLPHPRETERLWQPRQATLPSLQAQNWPGFLDGSGQGLRGRAVERDLSESSEIPACLPSPRGSCAQTWHSWGLRCCCLTHPPALDPSRSDWSLSLDCLGKQPGIPKTEASGVQAADPQGRLRLHPCPAANRDPQPPSGGFPAAQR